MSITPRANVDDPISMSVYHSAASRLQGAPTTYQPGLQLRERTCPISFGVAGAIGGSIIAAIGVNSRQRPVKLKTIPFSPLPLREGGPGGIGFPLLLLAALLLPLAATVVQATGLVFIALALRPAAGPRLAATAVAATVAGLYFVGRDSAHGAELWQTDGTPAGTRLVADIHPGPVGSDPSDLTAFNGRVYFAANDGPHGAELWQTDGTAVGTRLVADINPDAAGAAISDLTVVGPNLFFIANDGQHGRELWVFDGEAASLVKDIKAGSGSSDVARLTNVNGHLMFAANDGVHGYQVWVSDGGALDTSALAGLNPGGDYLAWLGAAGAAPALLATSARRARPWRLAAAAPVMIKDIHLSLGANPLWLTAAGNSLFYIAAAGTRGWDLWDAFGAGAGRPAPEFLPPSQLFHFSVWLNQAHPSPITLSAAGGNSPPPGRAPRGADWLPNPLFHSLAQN